MGPRGSGSCTCPACALGGQHSMPPGPGAETALSSPLLRRSPAGSLSDMAKVCHSCGKGPSFGHSRSHSMVATKRRFNPNLQKVRIDVGGTPRREYVCTRCLKAGKVLKAV